MADVSARWVEINQDENGEFGGKLIFENDPVFTPGQYFLAQPAGEVVACSQVIFPAGRPAQPLAVAPPLPVSWQPGVEMRISGPFGSGFHIPPSAHRVALASLDGNAARLYGVLELALAQQADVTLFLDGMPSCLPAVVEVQPPSQLPAALAWADYLALDVAMERLSSLLPLLGISSSRGWSCPAEVLLRAAFPCAGLAACGICAVRTCRGHRLACKDGPVFSLADLEF